jgi:hypothetical protein
MMSGHADPLPESLAARLLAKPFLIDDLASAVHAALAARGGHA